MLTDKACKSARPAPGKRYRKLADGGGLFLFVTATGGSKGRVLRSWRYGYRLHGKQQTFAIGRYPAVGLAEARERHLAARKLVDFSGPHGWEHSATNLGRTTAVK